MKKFTYFKIVQLSLLAVLALVCGFILFQPSVKQFVFSDVAATALFFMIWVLLIAELIFILIDFTIIGSIKTGDHTLYGAAYSDQVAGIPNRFSCDTVIEKYYDVTLPRNIACMMIDLTNLTEINQAHGHAVGNRILKEFSSILSAASLSLCFVGRNGGNKFLAIFEHCTDRQLEAFSDRISRSVTEHNEQPGAVQIAYSAGVALNSDERLDNITELIALANSRIYES
jgi:diguanylate cyclase (GGDEF)-like protein